MARAMTRAEWEGFGPDDPDSPRAKGHPRPAADEDRRPPSKRDVARLKGNARGRDREHEAAYRAGAAGGRRDDFAHDPELADTFDQGREESARARGRKAARSRSTARPAPSAPAPSSPAPSSSSSSPTLSIPSPSLDPHNGAGFLVGLIGYALVLAYLRQGPAGVKGWLSAKFINKPLGSSSSSSAGVPSWVQPGQVLQPGTGAAGEPIYGTPPNPATGQWPSGVKPAPGTFGSGGGAI